MNDFFSLCNLSSLRVKNNFWLRDVGQIHHYCLHRRSIVIGEYSFGKLCESTRSSLGETQQVSSLLGTSGNSFGKFTYDRNIFVSSFMLVHRTGTVTCNKHVYSYWGCTLWQRPLCHLNSPRRPPRENTGSRCLKDKPARMVPIGRLHFIVLHPRVPRP